MHEFFVDIKQKSVIAGWLILWAPYLINGKGVGTCYTYIYLFVDWKKECINLSKLSDDAWYYTKKLSLQCLIGIKLLLHLII